MGEPRNPVAVIIRAESSEDLSAEDAARDWALIDRIRERNQDKDPDAEMPFITRVVEEVRQARYERTRRETQDNH